MGEDRGLKDLVLRRVWKAADNTGGISLDPNGAWGGYSTKGKMVGDQKTYLSQHWIGTDILKFIGGKKRGTGVKKETAGG